MKVVLILLCSSILTGLVLCDDDLSVCCKNGCVLGTVLPGHRRQYQAFLGIPYAKPPVGELRFKNPVPASKWFPEKYNGTYSRATCIQKIYASHSTFAYGDEDCLYMNIYRPILKTRNKLLPVIVLITGGGFTIGTGSNVDFSPDYLMNRDDIMLIVLQHRLGVFGYLCSGDSSCPGNFGLKDQQMALEWIRDNVDKFGGNPASVTLLGQGSGCAAVQMHMMNARSSLLFHRVILQSGSLAHWALLKNPKKQFQLQAKYVDIEGYKTLPSQDLVDKLRKVDAVILRESADKFKFWHFDHLVNYRPCVEDDWEDAFLTENPYWAWDNGTYTPKPMLITFTPVDGTYRTPILTNETLLDEFNEQMRSILPQFLEFPSKDLDVVLKFYFKGKRPVIDEKNEKIFLKMVTDRYFHQAIYNTVTQFRSQVNTKKFPIYLYKFNFVSEFRYTKRITATDRFFGVGYRDDLLFMFRIPSVFPDIEFDSVEERMSDIYGGVLVHFAVHGKEKQWLSHQKCSRKVNEFCQYQEFQKYSDDTTNEVIVSVSDRFRVNAAKFWNLVDQGE
ncbi:Carboxylesterase, type B [Sergentomyia squamirostris]